MRRQSQPIDVKDSISASDNRSQKRSSRSKQKISGSSVKKNFPSDFFAKRSNSRGGSQSRAASEDSSKRQNPHHNEYQDSRYLETSESEMRQFRNEQVKSSTTVSLPQLARNQSAPMLQFQNNFATPKIKRANGPSTSQFKRPNEETRNSLQVMPNSESYQHYIEDYNPPVHQDTYGQRKMSQPDKPQRLQPLQDQISQRYDDYKAKANQYNQLQFQGDNGSKERPLHSKQSAKIIQKIQSPHPNSMPLNFGGLLSSNEDLLENNSLVSTSKFLPMFDPPLDIPVHQPLLEPQVTYQIKPLSKKQVKLQTPFMNPLQQSVDSVVSLMSTGKIGSININNVQSIHIHNNVASSNYYSQGMQPQYQSNVHFQQQQWNQCPPNPTSQPPRQPDPDQYEARGEGAKFKRQPRKSRSKSKEKHQVLDKHPAEILKLKSNQISLEPSKRKAVVMVKGTQDDVMARIQSQQHLVYPENARDQILDEDQMASLHQRRSEVCTPQFNEPRKTVRQFPQAPSSEALQKLSDEQAVDDMLFDKADSGSPSQHAFSKPPSLKNSAAKNFLNRISSQNYSEHDLTKIKGLSALTERNKASGGSERPSHLSQFTNNSSKGTDNSLLQLSERKKAPGAKKKVVLMHKLGSVHSSSGNRSIANSLANSNRPSKTSANEDRLSQRSHQSENPFERAEGKGRAGD